MYSFLKYVLGVRLVFLEDLDRRVHPHSRNQYPIQYQDQYQYEMGKAPEHAGEVNCISLS